MDALKIDKAHVLGHSMGAYTGPPCGDQASATLHFSDRGRVRLGLAANTTAPEG
jgi:pimeloyl-ACP methyl ester carboxylesterase